jgi:hypothetical protein
MRIGSRAVLQSIALFHRRQGRSATGPRGLRYCTKAGWPSFHLPRQIIGSPARVFDVGLHQISRNVGASDERLNFSA